MIKNTDKYDKAEMHYKDDILTFSFGEYPAIGNNHFEIRRNQRTKTHTTDIFGFKNLSDRETVLKCLGILEKDKYQFVESINKKNKPSLTEFVVAFQTDETTPKGEAIYIFMVLCINFKETSMNDIKQGEEFLACITIVKDKCKRKVMAKVSVVEVELSYIKLFDKYLWTDQVKFCQ